MSCPLPSLVFGAQNARIAFEVLERNAAGKLIPVDLTPASSSPGFVFACFRKPSGAQVTVACTVETPPSSGVASYLTAPGFLDEFGEWEAQAWVHLASAPTVGRGLFPSAIVRFLVHEPIRPFAPLFGDATPSSAELELALPAVSVS